jgi:hypothetical protein
MKRITKNSCYYIYAGLTLKAVLHVFARAPGFLSHKADHLETAFGRQGHIIKVENRLSFDRDRWISFFP